MQINVVYLHRTIKTFIIMSTQVKFSGDQMNIFDKVAMRCKMDWWFEDYKNYEGDSDVWSDDVSNLLEGYICNPEMFADFTEDEKCFIEKMIEIFY